MPKPATSELKLPTYGVTVLTLAHGMSDAPYLLTLLSDRHDRVGFHSDSPDLNRYMLEQVTQDVRRRVATCFVAQADGQRIAGYYTLSSTSLLLTDLPASIIKKLPRYPTVPAVRMGHLAVDPSFKGKGLGGALLTDALSRAARAEIAAYALVVDAKDEVAKAFYLHHGLLALPESSRTLLLPLVTVRSA